MPSMSDGRAFTSYSASWEETGALRQRLGASTDRQFREMMQSPSSRQSVRASVEREAYAAAPQTKESQGWFDWLFGWLWRRPKTESESFCGACMAA